MVFWKTYPLLNVIQAKFNREIFKSQIFNKEPLISPTGVNGIFITIHENNNLVSEVKQFIKKNFGSPPKSPLLDIPENMLLGSKDHILIVRDIDKNIVGCIRYHYLGNFITSQNEEIYCEDCFTVHKKWRGKGIGDYLLTRLHIYVNKNNIPYSLFLKEGMLLPIIVSPIYTGVYVYKKLNECIVNDHVKSLSSIQAYKLIDLFRELNPGMFIIRNIQSQNQFWKLYKNETQKVLVCFQDTFQRFEENGRMNKICWATAWIESSNLTDENRKEAAKELSALMYPEFDYVWINKEWVGNDESWKTDGIFSWYSYQWTTAINIKKSYCILN